MKNFKNFIVLEKWKVMTCLSKRFATLQYSMNFLELQKHFKPYEMYCFLKFWKTFFSIEKKKLEKESIFSFKIGGKRINFVDSLKKILNFLLDQNLSRLTEKCIVSNDTYIFQYWCTSVQA